MAGHRPEDAVIVIPHSNMFSVRDTATRATRQAVRALEHGLGIPCRMVAEHRAEEAAGARLIVLPAPRVLTESCWRKLVRLVEGGATLLATGFLEADEYWRRLDRLAALGLRQEVRPVCQTELVDCRPSRPADGARHADFRGDGPQKIERAVLQDDAKGLVRRMALGAGSLLLCPVPVELAPDAAARVYREAAECVFGHGVLRPPGDAPGLLVRRVEFAQHTLFLLVNDSAVDLPGPRTRRATPGEHLPPGVSVPAGRIALAFVERATGRVASKYEPL